MGFAENWESSLRFLKIPSVLKFLIKKTTTFFQHALDLELKKEEEKSAFNFKENVNGPFHKIFPYCT